MVDSQSMSGNVLNMNVRMKLEKRLKIKRPFEGFIVIAPQECVPPVKPFKDRLDVICQHRSPEHVSGVKRQKMRVVLDFPVVPVDESVHHLRHRSERTVTQMDDIVVPVVFISGDEVTVHGKSSL